MSADAALSHVSALSQKGAELLLKGHHARAAEKFRTAAAAARDALRAPDCLVVATLRVDELDATLCHATSAQAQRVDKDAALREACLRLLPAVAAVLQRRRAAGTLLAGACHAHEEAWGAAEKRLSLARQGMPQAQAARRAALLAPLVGYEAYVRCATFAAYALCNIAALPFETTDAQAEAACAFVTGALDMMAQPRAALDATWLSGEPELVRRVRQMHELFSALDMGDCAWLRRLQDAWQRVQRSGVLRRRGIEAGIEDVHQLHLQIRAAAAASCAARGLRGCALAGCEAREVHPAQFKKCAACQAAWYCCKAHQQADWPAHKTACKAARKAAAAAAAGCAGPSST
jgi:hypothetical protein